MPPYAEADLANAVMKAASNQPALEYAACQFICVKALMSIYCCCQLGFVRKHNALQVEATISW